jgi:hypothetical protein
VDHKISESDSNQDDIGADVCQSFDAKLCDKDSVLTQIKELVWAQKKEIECSRRLLQRKDNVISILSNLLNSTGAIDQVGLSRVISSCSSAPSKFGGAQVNHGQHEARQRRFSDSVK